MTTKTTDLLAEYHKTDYMDDKKTLLISKIVPRLRKKHTLKEIAKLLDVSEARARRYGIYGTGTFNNYSAIDSKDTIKNRCKLCSLRSSAERAHPIHHIGNQQDHRPRNLVMLCNTCHTHVHWLKRKSKECYDEMMSTLVS